MSMVGGIASLGASLFNGGTASNAAQTAAAQQAAADNQAETYLQGNLASLAGNYQPYMSAGTSALSNYANLLGINGAGAQQSAMSGLQTSPQYQALFDNGQNTILANAAATGGLRSGNTQASLAQFGENTLAQMLNQQEGQLSGLANMGLAATGGLANATTNTGNQIANLMTSAGNAAASGTLGSAAGQITQANQMTGALSGLANNASVQNLLGSLF